MKITDIIERTDKLTQMMFDKWFKEYCELKGIDLTPQKE